MPGCCYCGKGIPFVHDRGTCKRGNGVVLQTGYGPCHFYDGEIAVVPWQSSSTLGPEPIFFLYPATCPYSAHLGPMPRTHRSRY